MNRTLGIALIALLLAGRAHAAVSSPARESSLEDVPPAAVIAVERETAAPLVRESLERVPRLAIPMPGFGEFGTTPDGGAPAPEQDDAPPSGLLQLEVSRGQPSSASSR